MGVLQIAKTVVFIDMDDVLCAYSDAHKAALLSAPLIQFPQSVPGFFLNLPPKPGAVEAVNELRLMCDLFVLSAPSTRNPHSYTEKRLWIEHHFDYDITKHLILSPNKGLLKGDYLVDDRPNGKGQDLFEGELILFGSQRFPDWLSVLDYLRSDSLPKG
ncbi:MAG: hypothetical protein C0478_14520 [Planctomyces sp.]|nr:hypothetical protein [Planctomyces sp.]